MPEAYIEPLTDRQECFKCHKTVTGKKKLSKCGKCEAITYCGRECQVADWPRHAWNCVPVMVTEIPGKGRGLVAAKNIKQGELLFNEKSSIEIYSDEKNITSTKNMDEVLMQFNKLPVEAQEQFHKLNVPEFLEGLHKGDRLIMQKFISNARKTAVCGVDGQRDLFYLPLNSALINHSCGPNVEVGLYIDPNTPLYTSIRKVEFKTEVIAIKDISKGDEITKCYIGCNDMIKYGFERKIRMKRIRETLGFDCNCFICLGKCVDQEGILRKLRDLVWKLDSKHRQKKIVDWEREAQIFQRMADLTEKLDIGPVMDIKMNIFCALAASAHLARNEEVLGRAMNSLEKLVDESNLVGKRNANDRFKHDTTNWTSQRKSKKQPKKEEINSFLSHMFI